jgi:hypothetical protein
MISGIKVRCPIPLCLESVGLPNIKVALEDHYVEATFSPAQGPGTLIEVQCSSATAAQKKQLKEELDPYLEGSSHDVTLLWTTLGGSKNKSFPLEKQLFFHCVEHTREFFSRKDHEFSIHQKWESPLDLMQVSGKFTYRQNEKHGSLPYPAGWSFLIVKWNTPFATPPPSDQQALILSEALYKNNPFLLNELATPLKIREAFAGQLEHFLCAWPLPVSAQVLFVFPHSQKRQSFLKAVKNSYHCEPTALDTLGIHVV